MRWLSFLPEVWLRWRPSHLSFPLHFSGPPGSGLIPQSCYSEPRVTSPFYSLLWSSAVFPALAQVSSVCATQTSGALCNVDLKCRWVLSGAGGDYDLLRPLPAWDTWWQRSGSGHSTMCHRPVPTGATRSTNGRAYSLTQAWEAEAGGSAEPGAAPS